MKTHTKESKLQTTLNKTIDQKKVFGTSFAIKHNGETWMGASGNIAIDQPYFIASATKLFTTAIILQLHSQGKLGLDEAISSYLDKDIVRGLHIFKDKDYSN